LTPTVNFCEWNKHVKKPKVQLTWSEYCGLPRGRFIVQKLKNNITPQCQRLPRKRICLFLRGAESIKDEWVMWRLIISKIWNYHYGRHHELLDRYEISISQITMVVFLLCRCFISSITVKTSIQSLYCYQCSLLFLLSL
jgi:hypothetical protein